LAIPACASVNKYAAVQVPIVVRVRDVGEPYGSVRRLKIFGKSKPYEGLGLTRNVPGALLHEHDFQLSYACRNVAVNAEEKKKLRGHFHCAVRGGSRLKPSMWFLYVLPIAR
jgi:hypothetical protein